MLRYNTYLSYYSSNFTICYFLLSKKIFIHNITHLLQYAFAAFIK